MALGDLLSSASVIVALATLAGMSLLRGRITDLREQLKDARDQIAAQKERSTEDKATIDRQTSDIDALRRVVTGEVHWQAISDLLDHHHEAAERHWTRDESLLAEIIDELKRHPT